MVTFASEAKISLYDLVDVHDELAAIFGRDVDVVEKAAVVNPYRRRSIEKTSPCCMPPDSDPGYLSDMRAQADMLMELLPDNRGSVPR